jgi:hypothetical protein
VGSRAGPDGCRKSRHHTDIRHPDRPARSESLYRLSYPGPPLNLFFISFIYTLSLLETISTFMWVTEDDIGE